ncbi:choice-of-anchor K domain-containing protein [Tolypothrix sp. FACHB-123]|uniref:choice-of-anchor K domain-containing protein n=1 Tax=Tolypothrix sp. FACHB-123 TaxID=2692868 RepID=UPI0016864132|nr:choice-of-anchor K domain-containing protein [Tolypothrix sp. FACHB-123]
MNISLVFATALSGCSMLALSAFGFSSKAQAFTISGTADGVWSNPILDSGNICINDPGNLECPTITQGVGTKTFNWGTVAANSSTNKPNELTFTGNSFSEKLGSWFKIGSLQYFNGLIYADTNVKNVTLNLDLSFSDQQNQVNKSLPVRFNLVNTLNTDNIKDPVNADRVEFITPIATTNFKLNLNSYQFEIGGFSDTIPSFSNRPQTSISALEDAYATVPGDIYARVTYGSKPEAPPRNNVPEPSTIAGSCLAGIYLLYRKKLSKQKAKSSCE